MAKITLAGNPVNTCGELPQVGSQMAAFELVKSDMGVAKLEDFAGKRIVLNIFPSVDTGVCAASVRKFNEVASTLENTVVLCISRDLPFAQSRFCAADGLSNVVVLSDFRSGKFGDDNGLTIVDGALAGLHSRVIIVLNESGEVVYTEQVPEITSEPNYDNALSVLK